MVRPARWAWAGWSMAYGVRAACLDGATMSCKSQGSVELRQGVREGWRCRSPSLFSLTPGEVRDESGVCLLAGRGEAQSLASPMDG